MTIAEINNYYKTSLERRNLKHVLGSLISSYIIYETHKQNLYANSRRDYVDYQIYCNSANALLLEVRNFLNYKEPGTEAWLIKQMGSLNLKDFQDYNAGHPLSTTASEDSEHYKYVEGALTKIKSIKRQFDGNQGEVYNAYQQVKLYETLEFHMDKTPEKHDSVEGGFLGGFIKNKSFDVLGRLDEIMSAIDYLIDLQEQYEDCLDGGFPYEAVLLKRSGVRGLVGDIYQRLGSTHSSRTSVLRAVKDNLPHSLHYMGWR